MDSTRLARMFEVMREKDVHFHSVLIIRHGYIVAETYIYPVEPDSSHALHSCTKSFVSALVGIAIDRGYINGVDHPVLDSFPNRNFANPDLRKETMALEDLLTMRSGLDWPEANIPYSDPTNIVKQWVQSEDWVQFVLDRPMKEAPGMQFNYNTGGSHCLSAIVQETTGTPTVDFARANLFQPLGISDVSWKTDPRGIADGGGALRLTPRDMAKFGYLYLREGVWDGQQVVPRDWVAASVKAYVTVDQYCDYGYQWWIHRWLAPHTVYAAHGYGGQFIYVMPDLDMVVVFTGGFSPDEWDQSFGFVEDFIIPAVKSTGPLRANPRGVASLESQIEKIQRKPEHEAVPPLPAMSQHTSGKTYMLQDNRYDWQSFTLDFLGQEAFIRLSLKEDRRELAIGLDNVFRVTDVDQLGHLFGSIALSGSWHDDDTFVLHLESLNGPHRYDLSFDFNEAGVVVMVTDFTEGLVEGIQGKIEE